MELRDYQNRLIQRTRKTMQQKKKILIVAPTGSGKTALIIEMIKTALSRNKKILFFVHQKKLIEQTAEALKKQGVEFGYCAAGYSKKNKPLMLCMIQSYNRRAPDLSPDLTIIDEAHRAASNIYIKAISRSQYLIGLTATPQRTDGKPLGDYFQEMIVLKKNEETQKDESMRYLIDLGFLCEYELFGPTVDVDYSNVKTKNGDYDAEELAQVLNKATITGDAVGHYKKLAYGKKTVAMCVNVEHAKAVAENYRAAGIPALYLAGECSDIYQKTLFKKFEAGEIFVITAVNLLIEGVDIPSIECIQWLRPTKSIIVWRQGNGRGFRNSDGKEKLIILDHVRNYQRHGLPCDDVEWSLEGKKKSKIKTEKIEKIKICKSCFLVYKSELDACPHCGAEPEKRERKLYEVVEGELQKVTEVKRKSQKTIGEIIQYGIAKGYKNPEAWAAHIHASRLGRKPVAEDFEHAKKLREKIDERHHAISSIKFDIDL